MSTTILATGVTLIDFLNKSLETLKIIQKDDLNSNEIKLHLSSLTQQLSLTMVEASQLQGILAQKNEEIRQLKQDLDKKNTIKYDSQTEVYWEEGEDSPYCPRCFEADGKYIHLAYYEKFWDSHRPHHSCDICKRDFFKSCSRK
ncbi:hypothetical protein [Plesiomonas shigelloides]|uniref:hypothetical protein n=1 Tax=Plesiomonas shigelloides TaxID=703 RepID=UPI0012616628|nr:hypothetical protein [Plesiomonas shigelloides]KAB7687687.1 hypothetical protein GBN20_09850 [Plesiomonas shigelloides]